MTFLLVRTVMSVAMAHILILLVLTVMMKFSVQADTSFPMILLDIPIWSVLTVMTFYSVPAVMLFLSIPAVMSILVGMLFPLYTFCYSPCKPVDIFVFKGVRIETYSSQHIDPLDTLHFHFSLSLSIYLQSYLSDSLPLVHLNHLT